MTGVAEITVSHVQPSAGGGRNSGQLTVQVLPTWDIHHQSTDRPHCPLVSFCRQLTM